MEVNKESENEPWKQQNDKELSIQELIRKRFEEHNIIPEFLIEAPQDTILIIYQSGVKINLGNCITSYQSKSCPCLFYWPVVFGQLYTIMIIDIDYPTPSNPIDRSYLIFLVCNIHANDIMKGDFVAEYRIPDLPKDSEKHRILILGFKQQMFEQINTRIKRDNHEERLKFSLKDFIEKYHLDDPIVGNFFFYLG